MGFFETVFKIFYKYFIKTSIMLPTNNSYDLYPPRKDKIQLINGTIKRNRIEKMWGIF